MPIDIIKTFFSFEATLFIGPTLKLALPTNSMSKKYDDDI